MNNLFIMHTQYNLILACGIAKSHYKNDTNDLVLYSEFNLSPSLKSNLEKSFDNVYYIQNKFFYTSNVFKSDLYLLKCLKNSRVFLKKKYDNVFISQEREYDTYLLSILSRKSKFNCFCVEEDVYFSVDNARNREDYSPAEKTFKGKLRVLLKSLLFGKNTFYENCYFYGMNSHINKNFVLFPSAVRIELSGRPTVEITDSILSTGIETLYKNIEFNIPKGKKIILFYFDLIERYNKKEEIIKFVDTLSKICMVNNVVFCYKYHPRETSQFSFLKENKCFYEFPSIIPSEKISLSLKNSQVAVVGNLTTALWVSAKMNMKTFSVIKLENPENTSASSALNKMNIKTPSSFDELINELRRWIEL